MKDLKKYRIPIIGGLTTAISWFLLSPVMELIAPLNIGFSGAVTSTLIVLVINGAITAFIIDKVWK